MGVYKKLGLKKLKKAQRKKLASIALPVLVGLFGLVVGIAGTRLLSGRTTPANLVWPAEKTVKIPKDLRKFLEKQNSCEHYRGTDSPSGVGLWGVYQVSRGQYAKIAYGCSWNLSSYIMAVKQKGMWQLVPPAQYFAPFKDGVDPSKGALPFCATVATYKIPGDIEPFCIQPDGSAKPNEL